MRRTVLYLGFSFVLAAVAVPQPPAAAPELPQLPGLAVLRYSPALRAAVEEAFAAVEKTPRDATANGRLAMVLHANHLFDEAEVCYRRAHLLDPASFRWTYLLGVVQARQGDCAQAISVLREALQLEPEYLPARLNLGGCLLGSGLWPQAGKVYEAILAKHPGSAEAYYGIGRVRAVNDDLNGAIVALRKACELFLDFGAAHYALGRVYERLDKKDLSAAELALFERLKNSTPRLSDPVLAETLALDAGVREALLQGEQLAREGKLPEAAAAYEKALAIAPTLVPAHVYLISVYGRLGQDDRAEEHFRAAVALKPDEPDAHFNHGLLLASQENFPDAEQAFRRTLDIQPVYPGARLNLGFMLEAQGKLPEALAEYQKAVQNDATDSQAQFNAGRILVHQQNYQEGIQHLLKSLSTTEKENKPSYLYAVGAAYVRAGDRANGLHYLSLARQEAAALEQSKLVESIDDDLRTLGAQQTPR
jgi:tetratricopeptide (TPR) repeat protein